MTASRTVFIVGFWVVALLVGNPMNHTAYAQDATPLTQERIDAAAEGDTLWVESGTHDGPFVIERPLTLMGVDRPHLQGDGETHVVRVDAPRVHVEGFTISRSGTDLGSDHAAVMVRANHVTLRDNDIHDSLHGIYLYEASYARIDSNRIVGKTTIDRLVTDEGADDGEMHPVALGQDQRGNGIHLWKTAHNVITQNHIRQVRDGIYFSFADDTHVSNNTIHHSRYGLHYMYSDDNRFSDNMFYHNAAGAALMYSENITVERNVFRDNRTHRGYGILLQSVENTRIHQNDIVRNATGLYLENSHWNAIQENHIAANFRGLRLTGSSYENQFSENAIRANLQTILLRGHSATNTWHNDGRGNYWGAHGLLDLDGDGVSEVPYHAVDLLGRYEEDFPFVSLLAGSPGIDIVSHALQRLPPPTASMIVDEHPLMHAVQTQETSARPLRIGLLLLGVTAAVLLIRRPRS